MGSGMAISARIGGAAVAAALLAQGCTSAGGGAQQSALIQAAGILRQQATTIIRGPQGNQVTLSDAQLRAFEQDLLVIQIPSKNASAGLIRQSANRDTVTWRTPDGVTVVLKDGQIIGTAGLGNDLSSAAFDDIRTGSGRTVRDYFHLMGNERVERTRYICELTDLGTTNVEVAGVAYSARQIVETCDTATGDAIENRYWVQPSGLIRKSQQFISPEVGYLVLEDIHGGRQAG